MAVSPYVKAGVALASAAMIAAIPAIAPPLTPKDEQVFGDAQARLAASSTDLINIFFGVPPADGPVLDPDNAGQFGASGVVYRLLWDATNGDADAQEYVDTFFGSGFTGIVQQLLNQIGPSETDAIVDTFFEGGFTALSEQALLLLSAGNPDLQDTIGLFFEGGTSAVQQKLLNQLLPAEADEVVNDFYEGGATQVVGNAILDQANADQAPYVERFFSLGDYNADAVSPGERGIPGVVLQAINQVGPSETDELADTFFSSGVTGVTKNALLQAVGSNVVAQDLINEFFDNGAAGVVRYVLAGPAPEPASLQANLFSAKVSEDDAVDTSKVVDIPKSEKKAPEVQALSAPSPVASSPPADDPAPAAPVKKKFTINEDKPTGTEALETGNLGKAEPEVLIEGTGVKQAPSWGIFQGVADGISNMLKPKPATPSAPASPAGGEIGAAGGDTGGEGGDS